MLKPVEPLSRGAARRRSRCEPDICALDAAGLVRSRNDLVAGRVIRGEYRWNKESSGERSGSASSRVETSGAWTQMRVTARQPFCASGAKCRGCSSSRPSNDILLSEFQDQRR